MFREADLWSQDKVLKVWLSVQRSGKVGSLKASSWPASPSVVLQLPCSTQRASPYVPDPCEHLLSSLGQISRGACGTLPT